MIGTCNGCSTKNDTAGMIFQNERYGRGNRVLNACAKGVRCTCCGTEKVMDAKTSKGGD